MDESNLLELLELYMDMVEKQDEIIHQLGAITAKQATDLQLLKNDKKFFDMQADNIINEYETYKSKMN